jgi:hypothetical protein
MCYKFLLECVANVLQRSYQNVLSYLHVPALFAFDLGAHACLKDQREHTYLHAAAWRCWRPSRHARLFPSKQHIDLDRPLASLGFRV